MTRDEFDALPLLTAEDCVEGTIIEWRHHGGMSGGERLSSSSAHYCARMVGRDDYDRRLVSRPARVTWTEQPRAGYARRYRIACECHPDFVGTMESSGYDLAPEDDARRIADLTAEANRFHAAFVVQRAEAVASRPARVGDLLTRENARVGMRFRHEGEVGSCLCEVTGSVLCHDIDCDVRDVPIAFRCERRPIIVALPGAQAGEMRIAESVGGTVEYVAPAPVSWDGIPSAPVAEPRLCEHGYPLVGDCQRCEHDRRFYARGMNETASTMADRYGPGSGIRRAGYRLRRGEWERIACEDDTPQTRETRLEAAGFRVVDE